MSGISAVGTLTMGLIALPAMRERRFDKNIAIGSIAAGGAMGILILPSVPFIIYCMLTTQSVASMFLGGILSALLLTALFIAYISINRSGKG
jgi:TRAP-type C4-dicarboxylate transport system permease large subunit